MQKILIVEDEEALTMGLSDKFQNSGFATLVAKNGIDGLAQAMDQHPDLIILDILMPQMDGITLLKKLREDEWGKTAKVVMWSNSKDLDVAEESKKELGALDFLIKSEWTFGDVVKKAEKFLEP
ncbi:MAG: response regulator [bacterium]|nr:response regulator [bacterium]